MSNLENVVRMNLIEEMNLFPTETEPFEHSAAYEKSMKRLLDRMRGDKMHAFTKKTATLILIAAIILALCIAGFAVIVQRDFTIENFGDSFDYIINDIKNAKRVTDLTVGYIPEGFVLEEETKYKMGDISRDYTKGDLFFYIEKNIINSALSYNRSSEGEDVVIDGITYVFYGDENTVMGYVWNNGDYIFTVGGNLSRDELIKIALTVE